MSDINDRYPHDDADVIEIKQAVALVAIDLTRVAAHSLMMMLIVVMMAIVVLETIYQRHHHQAHAISP